MKSDKKNAILEMRQKKLSSVESAENLPDEANQDTMAGDVPRAVASEVDIRCDDTSAVSAHDLHRDTRSSLQAAAYVATVPGEPEWDLWVYS